MGRLAAWCLLLLAVVLTGKCHRALRPPVPLLAPAREVSVAIGDFERALQIILQFEGGYSNNPADTGGATNQGVTQRVYDAYRRDVGLAPRGVRQIERHEVEDVYEERYWDAMGCDELPYPGALVCFDAAVQHGVGRAKRFLREVGPDPESLIKRRERFYHAIIAYRPEAKVFERGWLRRMAHLRKEVAKHAI
jgi:hypothetical protein